MAKGKHKYRSDFARKYYDQGLEEGRELARREGYLVGIRGVLEVILRSKFGALSPETEARLAAATEAELDLWTERILTATSLDVVFGES